VLPRVKAVRHVRGYVLEVTFTDGVCGEIDFRERIVGRGGVFAPLEDVEVFRQARVDPEVDTLVWPNGVDLCPDVLYNLVTGAPLPGQEPATASAGKGEQATD